MRLLRSSRFCFTARHPASAEHFAATASNDSRPADRPTDRAPRASPCRSVLRVDGERDARARRGAMVGDMAQDDRRHAKPSHAGQRRAPQIMRRPWRNAESAERPFLAGFIGPQDRARHRDRRQRSLAAGKYGAPSPASAMASLMISIARSDNGTTCGWPFLMRLARQPPFPRLQVQLGRAPCRRPRRHAAPSPGTA